MKKMGIFRRKVPRNYLPIHPDNIAANDWIILLEAGTIVGPSAVKLRVALATLEKKVVTKYNIFLRKKRYLVLPGYDPRIHALYFCPQLYKPDTNKKLAPLDGEEIGQLIASSVWDGVVRKRPWYEPSEQLPHRQVVGTVQENLDTLVVEEPDSNAPRLSQNDARRKQMPKLTKKEGLFLSRLQDQGGRIAISGNKYDRLIKAGYVLPEHDSFSPDTIHFTLTATGRGALEIHKKKALRG